VITRRACIAGLAGIALKAAGASGLSALDEHAFRQMVVSHRGKVLLVDFWATWCAPCRDELPKLVGLYSAYKQKGLSFAAISCDEPEQEAQAAAFVNKQAAPLPHYIRRAKDDDQFINAVDPKWSGALPALFVFDRMGRQALSFIGETNMTKLEEALRRLLAT
jgi:thiol-disulfide isomerase/thioredoxin